jgi:hypothetical protein
MLIAALTLGWKAGLHLRHDVGDSEWIAADQPWQEEIARRLGSRPMSRHDRQGIHVAEPDGAVVAGEENRPAVELGDFAACKRPAGVGQPLYAGLRFGRGDAHRRAPGIGCRFGQKGG